MVCNEWAVLSLALSAFALGFALANALHIFVRGRR